MGSTHDAGIFLAIMNRHISALAIVIAVGKQLAHEVFQGKSTLLVNTSFAVLGESDIVRGQSCGRADGDTLFAL